MILWLLGLIKILGLIIIAMMLFGVILGLYIILREVIAVTRKKGVRD